MRALALFLKSLPSEVRVAALLAAVATIAAVVFTGDPNRAAHYQHLGAEYFNIAQALADGRGYSDPFGEATGPTAWTPPLLPAIQCVLLLLFEERHLVASGVLVLMHATFVGIGTAIYSVAKQAQVTIWPIFSALLFVAWALSHSYWFFVLTSDIWLISGVATLVLLLVARYARMGTLGRWWHWGAVGGLASLTSPVVMTCWAALLLFICLRRAHERKRVALAFLLAGYLALPWVSRNMLVFNAFIPSKSNLAFELHQANVSDEDGIYDAATMRRHPYNQTSMKFDYGVLGETAYVRLHGEQFMSALAANPLSYLERVKNRLLAATLRYVPLIPEKEGSWMAVVRKVLYALPFPSLLLCAFGRRHDRELVVLLGLFAGIFLAPYVLVAFYERYLFPLTPVLVMAIYLAADQVYRWLRERGLARHQRGAPAAGSAPHELETH